MKLFELRPVENLPDNDNPWIPWYDKCFGFIIRADSEIEARIIANENAGDENGWVSENKTYWKQSKYSTCIELKPVGESEMIMMDFHYA